MKVILLQDVAKIGRRSDLVEGPDGYALNQLIPKKMADPATPANKKKLDKKQAETDKMHAESNAVFEAAKAALAANPIDIVVTANEQGHLFKAVNEGDIAEAASLAGNALKANMIALGKPVKDLGEHQIQLVSGAETAVFTINVVKKS